MALTFKQTVQISPVNILYVGTESEFMREIDPVMGDILDTDQVEFTCLANTRALVKLLYEVSLEASAPKTPVVIYGFFRQLERESSSTPEILRAWNSIHNSGIQFMLAEEPNVIDRVTLGKSLLMHKNYTKVPPGVKR